MEEKSEKLKKSKINNRLFGSLQFGIKKTELVLIYFYRQMAGTGKFLTINSQSIESKCWAINLINYKFMKRKLIKMLWKISAASNSITTFFHTKDKILIEINYQMIWRSYLELVLDLGRTNILKWNRTWNLICSDHKELR